MKTTFLTTFWSIFISTLIFSNITISGYLIDEDGNGVAQHEVILKINWGTNVSDHLALITGNNGGFKVDLNEENINGAQVSFRYENCDNQMVVVEERLAPNQNQLSTKLDYCTENKEERCAVRVRKIRNNDGQITLKAIGKGSEPFRFIWSDGSTGETTTLPEDGSFCVTMTDANGCTARFCDDITKPKECVVQIKRLPANRSMLGFFLTIQARPGDKIEQIRWNTGDTSKIIRVDEPGRYCVTVVFSNGCVAETCIWIGRPITDPDCIKARVSVNYSSDIRYADLVVHYDPSQNLEFLWSTGETTDQIRVTESGIYTVIITDIENDCRIIRRVFVQFKRCEVEIQVRENLTGWTLTAVTPFSNNTPVRYRWSTGETTPSILVLDPKQTYCVMVITRTCKTRACVDLSRNLNGGFDYHLTSGDERNTETTEVMDYSSGKTNLSIDTELIIYPNPAQNFIHISSNQSIDAGATINVVDMQGRIIMHQQINQEINANESLRLNISEIPSGLYNLSIKNGKHWSQEKLLVH